MSAPSGGTASGTRRPTRWPARSRHRAKRGTTTAASIAASSARNAATNALANAGKGSASTGAAVSTSKETMVPLAAFTSYGPGNTPLAVNHQGPFVASHHLVQPAARQVAERRHRRDRRGDARRSACRPRIHGSFAGTAQTFQQSLNSEPMLIVAALLAVYIVLGVLYESYIHPITILSTLPSAGVGAVLALLLFDTEFSIIALIGVILLIGIVKKNAIMMIDFALEAERDAGPVAARGDLRSLPAALPPDHDDHHAPRMLGALPLALGFGDGARAAPAARHLHRRRPDGQPGADALHHAGGLSVSRPLRAWSTRDWRRVPSRPPMPEAG